ncbi:MAG: hypothetical protein C0448_02260 [Sphingobacteriaceae bacterium]|nr:hypothetical protein [Sphingobacteriaceae bacterium]
MKHLILLSLSIISFLTYAQKPDVIPIIDTLAKPKFKKEVNVLIKAGTTVNFLNKELYKILNEGLKQELYVPDNPSTLFVNPYFSVGLEAQFSEKLGFHFNLGFHQTLQKYTTNYSSNNGNTSNNNYVYRVSAYEYLNNNVFLEILPYFKYKSTRFLAGFNLTSSSPTVTNKISITNLNTGVTQYYTIKDKPEVSYHAYSTIGIIQSFPVKTIEMTVTASYFGFLKKYDSGFNLMLGVLF